MKEKHLNYTELIDYLISSAGQRLLILAGPQGSGKSTLAKAILARRNGNFKLFRRLSTDKIKKRNPALTDEGVLAAYSSRLEKWLARGLNVVDDNLNATQSARRKTIERARAHGYTDIVIVYLDVPLAVCLEHNKLRKRPVAEWAIDRVWTSFYGSGRPLPHEARIIRVVPLSEPGLFFIEESAETPARRPQRRSFLTLVRRLLERLFA